MTNQSRRQFLKTGALFGAASAAAAVSAPAFSTEAPQKWDETTGLLIVGTGFAGCAAALEAHYLGAKKEEIMLVDKMSTPGGNSIINGGAVAAAGTDMQEKEGIKDSADLLFGSSDFLVKQGARWYPGRGQNWLVRRMQRSSLLNYRNRCQNLVGARRKHTRPHPHQAEPDQVPALQSAAYAAE